MLRAPHSTYESKNNPPPDIGLKLDSIVIDELNIAETLFRPVSKYKIVAAAARPREGSGFAELELTPLTGPGDKLTANAAWTTEGALKAEASASGPAGGLHRHASPCARKSRRHLRRQHRRHDPEIRRRSPPRLQRPVRRRHRHEPRWQCRQLNATLDADLWPALELVARRTGGAVTLKGEANLDKLRQRARSLLSSTRPPGM